MSSCSLQISIFSILDAHLLKGLESKLKPHPYSEYISSQFDKKCSKYTFWVLYA
jgi:hypothetical protein